LTRADKTWADLWARPRRDSTFKKHSREREKKKNLDNWFITSH
jgi:hypothetical protein